MKKHFFRAEFSRIVDIQEETYSNFDLGLFSNKKKAQDKIDMLKNLEGFKDYPESNFRIRRIVVDFENTINEKSGIPLYHIWHEYEVKENDEIIYDVWHDFGYYPNISIARKALTKIQKNSRLAKYYPNNFEINKSIVDKDYKDWSEGFKTY